MLAPQSGQTRLRIVEIKLMLVFLTTANEPILSLLFCSGSSPRMHRTLGRGAAGACWGGRSLERSAACASDSDARHEEQLSRQMLWPEGSASDRFYLVSTKEIG